MFLGFWILVGFVLCFVVGWVDLLAGYVVWGGFWFGCCLLVGFLGLWVLGCLLW